MALMLWAVPRGVEQDARELPFPRAPISCDDVQRAIISKAPRFNASTSRLLSVAIDKSASASPRRTTLWAEY
jgi:hypothetical protein